jgi:hypothetical protein
MVQSSQHRALTAPVLTRTSIEPLEGRITPATLINPGTVSFTDVDGDTVLVKTTRGTFDLSTDFGFASVGEGEQLQLLNLSASEFSGATITVIATGRGPQGDGLVNVGFINSSGISLTSVTVEGDLGKITVGAAGGEDELRFLRVRSMGLYGTATQAPGGDLVSNFIGDLGKLNVTGDIRGARIFVSGEIGALTIGGSLIGSDTIDAINGAITSAGNMGPVKIGGDIIGGAFGPSGLIDSQGKIKSVMVGGSVIGGADNVSGVIRSSLDMGPVRVGRDLIGGAGTSSGHIISNTKIASVTIGGSIIGGSGTNSATIVSDGELGPVKVGMNVAGLGPASAQITGVTKVGDVTIGGSLIGSSTTNSGRIFSDGDIGMVVIGVNVVGGSGDETGKIHASGSIAGVRIGGSLFGGEGDYDTITINSITHEGQIFAGSSLGAVKLGSNLLGGDGDFSGSIIGLDGIAKLTIGGSLIGGDGLLSARVETEGALGLVRINHDLHGGTGPGAGSLSATDGGRGVTIGGSLAGNSGQGSGSVTGGLDVFAFVKIGHDLTGGTGQSSGLISNVRNVTIGGSVIGGTGSFSGAISSVAEDIESLRIGQDLIGGSIAGTDATLEGSGYIGSLRGINKILIGGSIIAGTDGSSVGSLTRNASIRAAEGIGMLVVKGGLIGNTGTEGDGRVIIAADRFHFLDDTANVVIGKVHIGGRVEFAQIFAGYDSGLGPQNADAQIGSIVVGGDWIASSVVAGAVNLGEDDAPGGTGADADNVNFGDEHDFKITEGDDSSAILSRIGSIRIAGEIFGTPAALSESDVFGFVAEQIGAVKIGARSLDLQPGAGNDGIIVGFKAATVVHEISAPVGFPMPTPVPSAKLVNASTVVYTDSDGDRVTVRLSLPLLTAANVNDVFVFDNGTVDGPETQPQQLQLINLEVLATNGVGVNVSVQRGFGDGLAQVGTIRSDGFNIGKVSIAGDLGGIRGGATTPGVFGLESLKLRTYGRYGLDTQPEASPTFTPQLGGEINGGIGALIVKRDVVGVIIDVSGEFRSVKIGGSLLAGSGVGLIFASGDIATVRIGEHLQGGESSASGNIASEAGLHSLVIGGSVIGGIGERSGAISVEELGSAKIGRNMIGGNGSSSGTLAFLSAGSATVNGSLIGGLTDFSGRITSDGAISSVKIGHNLQGGLAIRSGRIEAGQADSLIIGGSILGGGAFSGSIRISNNLGSVKIGHDLRGGAGNESGKIEVGADLGSLRIGGSVIGGSGDFDTILDSETNLIHFGQVFAGNDFGAAKIGHDVIGGTGNNSGELRANDDLTSIVIGGSLVGGGANGSGQVFAGDELRSLKVGRDVLGGDGLDSGVIFSNNELVQVQVSGSLIGGSANGSGGINAPNLIGTVQIGRDVLGGSAGNTGTVFAEGEIEKVSIGGSVIGGTATSTGRISSGKIGSIEIGHHLLGGTISGTAADLFLTGSITGGTIQEVRIGGSIVAGFDVSSAGALTLCGSILAEDNLGAIKVKGSLIGHTSPDGASSVTISARGQASLEPGAEDIAIESISVGGRVERAQILAGYLEPTLPVNGNASIGSVKIGGTWIASDLVAGAKADAAPGTAPNLFGDADDERISPTGTNEGRIIAVAIKGLVVGTADGADHFGFVAKEITSFKSLGFTAPLSPGLDVIELSPSTGDVTIREA